MSQNGNGIPIERHGCHMLMDLSGGSVGHWRSLEVTGRTLRRTASTHRRVALSFPSVSRPQCPWHPRQAKQASDDALTPRTRPVLSAQAILLAILLLLVLPLLLLRVRARPALHSPCRCPRTSPSEVPVRARPVERAKTGVKERYGLISCLSFLLLLPMVRRPGLSLSRQSFPLLSSLSDFLFD